MSGILFTTVAGSVSGMALTALTHGSLPLGMALIAYLLGGLLGMSVATTVPMLRKID